MVREYVELFGPCEVGEVYPGKCLTLTPSEKGTIMALLISAQLIARSEGWLAYRSIYLPSMSYSLPSTSFTRRELATIQRRPIRAILPAISFNRNMPLEVVFGPASIGGLGLRHLYVEQGCQKTSALLEHIRQHSRLGKMM
jgi:hypothetical protein